MSRQSPRSWRDGTVEFWRGSSSRDQSAGSAGRVDRSLAQKFLASGTRTPLAALHFTLRTHELLRAGHVSSDFAAGQAAPPGRLARVLQVYFNGCAGNVAAGKYNDGAPDNRPILSERIYAAMKSAWAASKRRPVGRWTWRADGVTFDPRSEAGFSRAANEALLADAKAAPAKRGNAGFQLSWLKRQPRLVPVGCLQMGHADLLVLPGEPFVEYQLFAQSQRPDDFCLWQVTATAARDTCRPRLPTRREATRLPSLARRPAKKNSKPRSNGFSRRENPFPL